MFKGLVFFLTVQSQKILISDANEMLEEKQKEFERLQASYFQQGLINRKNNLGPVDVHTSHKRDKMCNFNPKVPINLN